tara:strand:+ start:2033 stop:2329 length:297 start_codon:yes stop_codon:yes gene_type:complete
MFIISQLPKYYIAVLMSVVPPNLPSQGWVQMLIGFETREECKEQLASDEYGYFVSIMKHYGSMVKKIEMMDCMTRENIEELNEDLGHTILKEQETLEI